MIIKVLREAGWEEALFGLSLSFYDHKIPAFRYYNSGLTKFNLHNSRLLLNRYTDDTENKVFWTDARFTKAQKIALSLASKEIPEEYKARHNEAYISAEQKFLESIDVWVFIQASRDFWSEFDTYRVDMTKQSSSTMHTLSKRYVNYEDFELGTKWKAIDNLNDALHDFNNTTSLAYHNVSILKKNLPEGWLQERVIKTSYKTLKWILEQRDGHRLEQWGKFKDSILEQLEHPEYITLSTTESK
jgi:hypothetical protein